MTYLQNLFTSRDNNADAATYVGQTGRIWWDPTTNAFYYSDGSTPGGIPIGSATGTGIPLGPVNSVQINAGGGNFTGSSNLVFSNNVLNVVGNISATGNVAASYFLGNVDTAGNVVGGNILSNNYLYANGNSIFANVALSGNINLGNLYVIDQTIYGKNLNQDIVLTPRGDGYVSVPKLAIPVGAVIQDSAQVNPIIASLTLNQVIANSTGPGNTLPAGSYGNPGGVTHPWAVYQFTTVPSPILEVNDVIAGTGVPLPSTVQWVGNTSGSDSANANVVVTTGSYWNLPTPIPTTGNAITVTRALTLAGLNIITAVNTTINLSPGTAGNVIAGSSIIPAVSNAFDLGTPTARWRSIYFGGATIYVFDPVLGVDQSISASNGNLVVGGGTGLNVGSFTFFGNTIAIENPAENIFIGTEVATGNVVFNRPIQVLSNVAFSYPTFEVDRNGITSINVSSTLPATVAALNINGAVSGNSYPRNFTATLIQLTNLDKEPARLSLDSFGANVVTGQNAYGLLAARVARGNVDAPSQTLAGDLMFRFASQGYANSGAFIPNIVRYTQVARENFTATAAGTQHNFQATPTGTVTIKNIANIDAQGLTFSSVASGGPANIGITFQDGSYQNTAYIPGTGVVNSLTAAAGISLSSSTGNITIGSTGVLGVVGTTNQINVANVGNVLTLSLPQNLNTTANIQLNQLTVNDLIILGNVSNVTPAVVSGKIVFVANTATNLAGINTSGLVTGNAANGFYAGILYDTTSNTWVMDTGNSVGITSANVYADDIIANNSAHLGNANAENYDFTNALLQGDINIDTYGQFVLKNHSQTANASADIVAVANNGDDSSYYIDMGINSNVYANVDYAVTGFNDGYLYVNGGNLVIGTQTASKVINFFTGGTNSSSRIRGTISDTGLSMVGNITANNMISTNATIGGTVSASGNVIAAGNVIGGNLVGNLLTAGRVAFVGSGKQVIDDGDFTYNSTTNVLSVAGNVNATNFNGTFVGNIVTTGNVSTTGNVIGAYGVFSGGNTVINAGITTTGNITGGNLITGGIVSATGNITGNYFVGNGSLLTGIATSSYGNANVANFLANYGANIVSTTGNVTASYFIGNGSQLTGVIKTLGNAFTTISSNGTNITATTSTSTATLTPGNNITIVGNSSTNITVFSVVDAPVFSGNVVGGNITTAGRVTATGNVTGNYFIGNGSQLTGITGFITTITPNALSSTVHVAAVTTGNTANIITDATTANTANTLVLRDANGAISVNGWTVGTHLTAVNYTATTSDYWIGTTTKNKTITLPNAANGASTGRQYQIADTVHSGNPGTTIAAQSPATVVGNQPSQQGQIILATYVGTTWYLN